MSRAADDWSRNDVQQLIALVAMHGPRWVQLASVMGRSSEALRNKWKVLKELLSRGALGQHVAQHVMLPSSPSAGLVSHSAQGVVSSSAQGGVVSPSAQGGVVSSSAHGGVVSPSAHGGVVSPSAQCGVVSPSVQRVVSSSAQGGVVSPSAQGGVVSPISAHGGVVSPSAQGGVVSPSVQCGVVSPRVQRVVSSSAQGGVVSPSVQCGVVSPSVQRVVSSSAEGGVVSPSAHGGVVSPISAHGGVVSPSVQRVVSSSAQGGVVSRSAQGGVVSPISAHGGVVSPSAQGGVSSSAQGGVVSPSAHGDVVSPSAQCGVVSPSVQRVVSSSAQGGVVSPSAQGGVVSPISAHGGVVSPSAQGGVVSPSVQCGVVSPSAQGGVSSSAQGGVVSPSAHGDVVSSISAHGGVVSPSAPGGLVRNCTRPWSSALATPGTPALRSCGTVQPFPVLAAIVRAETVDATYDVPGLAQAATIANKGVVIRESNLLDSNVGLFAARTFEKGEVICFFGGEIQHKDECSRIPAEKNFVVRMNGCALVVQGYKLRQALSSTPKCAGGYYLPRTTDDRAWYMGPACFANHSQGFANARLDHVRVRCLSSKHLLVRAWPMLPVLRATSVIDPGTEILYNYGSEESKKLQAVVNVQHLKARGLQRDGLRVQMSSIEDGGLGLFAGHSMLRGTCIGVYTGVVRCHSYRPSETEAKHYHGYLLRGNPSGSRLVWPMVDVNLLSRINEPPPNTKANVCLVHVETSIEDILVYTPVVMSISNVDAGSELFMWYNDMKKGRPYPVGLYERVHELLCEHEKLSAMRTFCEELSVRLEEVTHAFGSVDNLDSEAARRVQKSCASTNSITCKTFMEAGAMVPDSRAGSSSVSQSMHVAWSHKEYISFAIHPPLFMLPILRAASALVPEEAKPHECTSDEDVLQLLLSTSFWDSMQHPVAKKSKKMLEQTINFSRAPRLRHFSEVVRSETMSDGRRLLTMYKYPRVYLPEEEQYMSPMPEELRVMCGAVWSYLLPVLPEASRRAGPFNSCQVRGYYEGLGCHTNMHSDGGQLDDNGLVDGGKEYVTIPGTVVVTYMIGDCEMLFDFEPTRDDRSPTTFKLGDGWILIMYAEDDCRCKHGVRLKNASKQLDPSRIRLAFVMRQLQKTASFDEISRKVVER